VASNEVASTLYRALGFVDTGKVLEGEIVYKLDLKG